MKSKAAMERAKEVEQTLVESGDIIRLGHGRVIRAKEFFVLPLEKQIELKHSVPRLGANHWWKGRPKRVGAKP
jgi:predicted PP-loop superfamily ATPase